MTSMKPDVPDVRGVAAPKKPVQVPANLQAAADAITNQRKAMTQVNRQVANSTWGDKSLSAKDRQMFVDFGRSIGLNAALGHFELMGGRPYITHKGLLHLLNEGEYNWQVVGRMIPEDSPEYAFWCETPGSKVWEATITGQSRKDPNAKLGPYVDFGVAHASEFAKMPKIRAPQMAKKRAEHRAIRAVLAIDIPTVEEMYAEQFVDVPFTVSEPQEAQAKLAEAGDFEERYPGNAEAAPGTNYTKEMEELGVAPPASASDTLAQRIFDATNARGMPFEHVRKHASKVAGRAITDARAFSELPEAMLKTIYEDLTGDLLPK